jgi:hypothetical protein
MFRWVAWEDTGSTKKAIGITRLGSAAGKDSIFVGVRRDARYTVSTKTSKRGKVRTVVKSLGKKKEAAAGTIVKRPIEYAGVREKLDPRLKPVWNRIKGKAAQMLIAETYKAVDELKRTK